MCFLYRQSISIVYESKFKYIYRYFIKIDRCFCEILQSLPLRKCGLKFILTLYAVFFHSVTSLAEVWIEMIQAYPGWPLLQCHFPCGSVDWNSIVCKYDILILCHFPCGSVDWNFQLCYIYKRIFCHFPCGSVDWNDKVTLTAAGAGVTSLAEVWIEIERDCQTIRRTLVTSLAEVWIEIVCI